MASAPIPDQQTYAEFLNQTGSGPFVFSIRHYDKADLTVQVDGVDLAQSDWTLTQTTDAGKDGAYAGGEVTLVASVTSADVVVYLQPVLARTTQYGAGGLNPNDLNNGFNHSVLADQALRRDIARAAKAPIGSTPDATFTATVLAQLAAVAGALPLPDVFVPAGVISLEAYDAVGDTKERYDGTTTASSTAFSSAGYTFVAGDVGKKIAVFEAAAAGSDTYTKVLHTTIASVSSGDAVLTDAAGVTISGSAHFIFGTDDTTAYQAAVAAMNAAGGGIVRGTPGKFYYITGGAQATVDHAVMVNTGAKFYLGELTYLASTTLTGGVGPGNVNGVPDPFFHTLGRPSFSNDDAEGSNYVGSTTLSANMVRGSDQITVADTSDMEPGHFVVFESTEAIDGSILLRGEVNVVAEVISSTVIRMKYPALALHSVSGETVTVQIHDNASMVEIDGGEYIGHHYAGDVINGAGQHCFYLRNMNGARVRNLKFRGFSGYAVAGMLCDDVELTDIVVDGRPANKALVEGTVSNYGTMYWHQCRVRATRVTGIRTRHTTDCGPNCSIEAVDCRAFYNNTSGFRNHGSSILERYDGCRAIGCHTGWAPDSLYERINNCSVEGGGVWGLLKAKTASDTLRACDVQIDNFQVEMQGALADYPSTDALGFFYRAKTDRFVLASSQFSNANDTAGSTGVTIGAGRTAHDVSGVDIHNVKIIMTGGNADQIPLNIGAIAGFNNLHGTIRDIEIDAPDQNEIVRLCDGTVDARNLTIDGVKYVSETTPTATAMVTKSGADFANSVSVRNAYALNNFNNFPAQKGFFSCSVTLDGGNTGLVQTLSSGRYWIVDWQLHFTLRVILSNKGSSTGDVRIDISDLTDVMPIMPSVDGFSDPLRLLGIDANAMDAFNAIAAFIDDSFDYLRIHLERKDYGAGSADYLNNTHIENDFQCWISGSYPIDDIGGI